MISNIVQVALDMYALLSCGIWHWCMVSGRQFVEIDLGGGLESGDIPTRPRFDDRCCGDHGDLMIFKIS